MSEAINLRDVQKRTKQLSEFEDGLWDLLIGSIFMVLAFYPITRELLGPTWNMALFLSLLTFLMVGHRVARHFISGPRMGYVQPRRTPQMRLLIVVTTVMVLLTLGLVLLTLLSPGLLSSSSESSTRSLVRSYGVEWIVVIILGAIFSVMGYRFGVARLFFYGWMLGFANLASVYMTHTAGWTFPVPAAIAAGIILAIGFMLLLRFLHNYPIRTQEA